MDTWPVKLMLLASSTHRHFDLNHLWTKQKDFAADAFVTLVETMQVISSLFLIHCVDLETRLDGYPLPPSLPSSSSSSLLPSLPLPHVRNKTATRPYKH